MENNNNKDVINLINEELNLILIKTFELIEEKEKINEEKYDADIKFNTLNLDDIISQVNNNNIFTSFDNIILSNSMNNLINIDNENKKEPIKINNIEELLLNEEQITEIIYTYDKRYQECFNETNILKLIDYSTHMPYISDDEIITHKYPFYACELLKCDAPYIYECFFKNERIISYFFDFLNDSKNNTNCVLSGYFAKIFLSLLDKKSDEIINYIFKEDNLYIEQIIELCDNSSFCECIKNLLTLQTNNYEDKKLFIIKRLNQKIFRNEEYTNNICFEIYGSLFEEGNLIFCNFFLKNFEKIYLNFKHKSFNLELFFYYIHLVRIIKECFTREKENDIDVDTTQITRKELNNYVIENKNIFLDFEMSLIDTLTDFLFIQNSVEDNIENITYRRIIVSYLDILEYVIFTISIKLDDKDIINKNEKKDYKYYINKIHEIFTNNILLKITNIIFKYPLFNLLQISYIKLFSTLSKINSSLLNNDIIINKFIENLINDNSEQGILLSFLVKILSIIYLSLEQQNINIGKKLRYIYDCLIKNIANIFESKLLFNQTYGKEKELNNLKNINADEIENINVNKENKEVKENKILTNINNNINYQENENNTNENKNNKDDNNININNINNNKNDDNNKKNYIFKEVVNKGIYDYISVIRFCGSSKNLTSADNISEEIDLDDINEDDNDENDNIGNNKNFVLTSFDELDDEDNISDNDSIDEIYKKTTETIKAIKLRNKMNTKEKEKEKEKNLIKEENNENKNEDKKIFEDKKEQFIKLEEKKINEILNKSSDKERKNLYIDKEIHNSLPLLGKDNDKIKNKMKRIKSELSDNPETSNKVPVKSIFNYNNKTINALPKIRKKVNENERGRYFHRDTNTLSRTGINLNDKINNFRSNNIIKIKENKETSLFNSLRKSSENGASCKYNLTLLNHNHIKHTDNNK